MQGPTIASLFSGTGALDLGVQHVFGGRVIWHSQWEPPGKDGRPDLHQYAARILARHFPDTPNLGDITAICWACVLDEHGPIDILTGGFPCTDVSSAGQRAGLNPDTRSGLWNHMARAITVLQPRLVVIENVEGLLSAPADRGLELDAEALDEETRAGRVLRALGAVLGDLATLGFDAEWVRVAASEIGAPHSRKRIIVLAWPAALDAGGLGRGDRQGILRRPGAEGRDAEAPADSPDLGHERRGGTRGWGGGSAHSCGHAPDTAGNPGRLDNGDDVRAGGGADGPRPAAGRSAAADTEGARREGRRLRGRPALQGHAAADADGLEPQRRGVAGVLGGPPPAEPGQGHQRQRAGHAPGDRGEAAADTDGRRREGHPQRNGELLDGQPGREPGLDADGRGVLRSPVEPTCPTCACTEWAHDGGGFCAGPCGGHCTDPDLGRPGGCLDEDCPRCAGETPADAPSIRHRDPGAPGERGLPATALAGDHSAERGQAPADTDPFRRRAVVLQLRPGQPDLDWGAYGPAIRRWEAVLGRPAPWPTDALGRLSAVFTEWMMGLPDGWVTCTPGLTRGAMLKALGNGVVWQQAAAAIRLMLPRLPDHVREHIDFLAAA